MRGKIIISIFVLTMALSLVVAQDLKVHVKTMPTHDVYTSILTPSEGFNSVQTLKQYSGYEGIANFDFSFENTLNKFDVYVVVKEDDLRVAIKRFEDQPAGKELYVEIMDEDTALISTEAFGGMGEEIEMLEGNETVGNLTGNETELLSDEETEEAEEEREGQPITGLIVSNLKNAFSKFKYYLLGIIVIAGILLLVVFGRNKLTKTISFENSKPPIIFEGNKLRDAERKLKEARAELKEMEDEINKVKNKKGRVAELKRKMAEEAEELKRLGGDKD